ncbi:MAG: hypothetical protein P4L22_03090 [Candidatus Babeliales bacterium]|nr:hypothetical protein [Candidatus Babeliales bacterium]
MNKKMFILLTFTALNIYSDSRIKLETDIKTKLPKLEEEDLRKIDNEIDEIISLEKKINTKKEELTELEGQLYLTKIGENPKNSIEKMNSKIKKCKDEINHLKEKLKK